MFQSSGQNLDVKPNPCSHLHHAHNHQRNAGAEEEQQTGIAEIENCVLALVIRNNEQVGQERRGVTRKGGVRGLRSSLAILTVRKAQ